MTFDVDVNGILSVTAKELVSGQRSMIKIEDSDRLDRESIDRAVRDAERFREEDEKAASRVASRNALESRATSSSPQPRPVKLICCTPSNTVVDTTLCMSSNVCLSLPLVSALDSARAANSSGTRGGSRWSLSSRITPGENKLPLWCQYVPCLASSSGARATP